MPRLMMSRPSAAKACARAKTTKADSVPKRDRLWANFKSDMRAPSMMRGQNGHSFLVYQTCDTQGIELCEEGSNLKHDARRIASHNLGKGAEICKRSGLSDWGLWAMA